MHHVIVLLSVSHDIAIVLRQPGLHLVHHAGRVTELPPTEQDLRHRAVVVVGLTDGKLVLLKAVLPAALIGRCNDLSLLYDHLWFVARRRPGRFALLDAGAG